METLQTPATDPSTRLYLALVNIIALGKRMEDLLKDKEGQALIESLSRDESNTLNNLLRMVQEEIGNAAPAHKAIRRTIFQLRSGESPS